jgi:hypothetical protein
MSRWEVLQDRARGLEAERQRREDEERALRAAREDVDAWATAALRSVWDRIESVLQKRVGDFQRGSGIEVRISEREHSRWAAGNKTRMLAIETSTVTAYLYSHQVSGFAPTFHLVEWPTSPASRRQRHRMVTLSLCRVERVGLDDFELVKADPGVGSVDYDDIAYRVLELLVVGMRRAVPRSLSFVEAVTAPELRPHFAH